MHPTKTCPACHEEFLSEAQTCPDCGAALVWSSEIGDLPVADLTRADWTFTAPGEILGQIAVDEQKVIATYVALLAEANIRAAVLPLTHFVPKGMTRTPSVFYGVFLRPGGGDQMPVGDLDGFVFMLFVRRDDTARADEILDGVFARLHPGQEEGLSQEFDLGTCPACGAAVPEAADACPDCGLVFGD
ncbi:MAG: hypothetical protein GY838_18725 [bacterium]|nr:hypothetical protein [bacterium]